MKSIEKTKKIRAALKAAGISNRQVSVRHRRAGYSSAWHITIKDNSLSVRRVREICERFQDVDRDDRTGEILAGGNDFVFVARAYDAPVDGSEYLEAVQKAISEISGNSAGVPIEGTGWNIFQSGGFYIASNEKYNKIYYNLGSIHINVWEGAAERLAQALKEHALDYEYLINCQ